MNRIYMTFPTDNDLKVNPRLVKAQPSALTDGLLYNKSETLIAHKNDTLNSEIKKYNIRVRPVINSNSSLIPFIEKNRINKGNYENILLGTYPLKIVNDVSKNMLQKTNKKRTIPFYYKMYTLDVYTDTDGKREFVILNDDIIELLPLEWTYDENLNKLFCKSILFEDIKCGVDRNYILQAYNYMNNQLFKEMLDNCEIIKDNCDIKLINNNGYVSFDYPYNSFIEFDEEGNVLFHDNEYKLTIPNTVKKIDKDAFQRILGDDNSNLSLNIDIDGEDLLISRYAFNLNSPRVDVIINSLTINNEVCGIGHASFNVPVPIKNITIPCDFALFSRLYLSGDNITTNLFENANFTLTYTKEKDLEEFVNDANRFFELICKSLEKEKRKWYYPDEVTWIDFSYRHSVYKHENALTCIPNAELIKNKEILSILKVSYFTLKGPTISDELVQKLFPNFSVKKEFTDEVKKDDTKQIEEPKEDKPKLSKEAEHILDLAREILSIDYIGLDKDEVKRKVTLIVNKYNNELTVKNEGLSLSSNDTVYTYTVLCLEALKNTLYFNFEEKIDYYDILDLISDMIKKLNGEEVKLNYEILKDLDTLLNILKYSKDENTKNEIISYLESEKQNIIDYLCGKKEIDYNDINSFIKKFRLYLVPILTKVSVNVSKIDVLEQIKKYTLNKMNNNSKERVDSYIKMLLSQIDNIKKEILYLDPSYTFNGIDYSLFSSGKEIIDYLENLYKNYYKVYLDLNDKKIALENYENSKVPLNF